MREKANKRKGSQIHYENFEMQNYFKSDSGISSMEAKRIFCLRSHSLDLAENFSQKYTSKECIKKCTNGQDSQKHLYKCPNLQKENMLSVNNGVAYEEIYGKNVHKQLFVSRLIFYAYEKRCHTMSSSEDPVGPQT